MGSLKNKVFRNVLSFFMAGLVTVLSVLLCSFLLDKKDSRNKIKSFYKEKQDIDVFFLGTSHGATEFLPMELWEDFGIISYNFAYHNAMLPMQYWILKNALRYKNPRLVVIDLFWLSQPWKSDPNHFGTVHTAFDSFPLSIDKICTVNDILDDNVPAAKDPKSKFGLLFPFSLYHSRWTEFYTDDFKISPEKGSNALIRVDTVPVSFSPVGRENKISEDCVGVVYLKKIIELCKENNIDVLMVYLPFAAWKECQMEANVAYDIAETYNIHYLNFLEKIDILNFDTDRADSVGHINFSGSWKINDFLGKYILENFNIHSQKDNPQYQKWNEDYDKYTEFKINNLKAQNSLDTYLMLLADKHFSSSIEIYNEKILQNALYVSLLKNSGADIQDFTLKKADLAPMGGDIAISVFEKDKLIDKAFFVLDEKNNALKVDD